MKRKQLQSIFKDAFAYEIEELVGHSRWPTVFYDMVDELRWKQNELVSGNLYWFTYEEIGGED